VHLLLEVTGHYTSYFKVPVQTPIVPLSKSIVVCHLWMETSSCFYTFEIYPLIVLPPHGPHLRSLGLYSQPSTATAF